MKIPLAWLGDFLELPADPEIVVRRLTEVGLECALERSPRLPEGVVTARIVECTKHPNAERLSVCRVDPGDGVLRTIVCGAPNARAGAVGVLALPGADLGQGMVIAERTMRGVLSQGMLCSAQELGLSSDAAGILLLPESTPSGLPLGRALHREPVLETEPASNRGDWLAIEGVARELAAALESAWTPRAPKSSVLGTDHGGWGAAIDDPRECSRYAGRVLEGVGLAESPAWMTERLEAAGHRPIGNLVDVTNWVLLELGHPLHAFDVDRLRGQTIGVRRAREGEKLVTLDGKERELSPAVLAITDESGPVALAGIMGGAPTAVGEGTRSILLEGASFASTRVRAGARFLRMTSDAATRFERGVDPHGVARALDRAVEILLEICPGARLTHAFDAFPSPPATRRVLLTRRNLRRILGMEIPGDRVRAILERLEFPVEGENDAGWTVRVPSFRRDVVAEEDLIEEVTRGYGVGKVPERSSAFTSAAPPAPRWDMQQRSRRCLLGLGLTEVVTPGLVDGARHGTLLPDDGFFGPGVPVRNPLSADRNRLRGSLVPGLLDVLATNRARSTTDLALFEVGRTFHARPGGGVIESARAAALLAGSGAQPHWIGATKPSDFFDMKGTLEVYVEQLVGETLRVVSSSFAPLSGNRSARVLIGAREFGRLGDVETRVRKSFDLPEDLPVFWAEWDLDELGGSETAGRLYEPLPRHPGAVRDLAFIVPRTVAHEALETSLRDSGGPLLSSIRLFDTYEGPPLGETEKSLAYTLVFRAPERSLTNDEVDALVAAIVDGAKRQIGARLR